MIKKYVKKPLVVEAVQWTGDNAKEVQEFMESDTEKIAIIILEWGFGGSIGDYIIKGVNGVFYLCKPDVFEKTYEEIK